MPIEWVTYLLGAVLNLVGALLIVRFIYYPVTQDKNYVFTFLAFNSVIYFVAGLLTSAELSLGVGFGLFAIFSVLRYRTAEIPTREMTYLFIVIALPVMNALLVSGGAYPQAAIANVFVIALLFVLERGWGFTFEASKKITYEKVELLTPANYPDLLADLRQRTGLPIKRVRVGSIDFSRDTAELKLYYDEPKTAGTLNSLPQEIQE